MIAFLSQSWPWYVAGPLLGLMVPILLFIGNKKFGISSSLQHICTATIKPNAEYFNYDVKEKGWSLHLAAGVIIGAAIAALFLDGTQAPAVTETAKEMFAAWGLSDVQGLMPPELFALESIVSVPTLIALLFGGFLVGFGARYANGCTSGHAIMGLSLLNLGSLVAVIGFFIGGLIVSNFVVPALLSLV
jgi:hypothetical protein